MKINNFNQLATNSLRTQGLHIAEAALDAIDTKNVIRNSVKLDQTNNTVTINGQKFNLGDFERVMAVGFGKCALDAVSELQNILGKRVACGFVLDVKQGQLDGLSCHVGTHPFPTMVNVKATSELVEMLGDATEKDLVFCVVSGGGSSLLCYPHELSCEQETSLIAALTVKGASIEELNTVRKHISRVKGGKLAEVCYPATMVSLIFSDVPGNDLSIIASGPTVKDTSTTAEAQTIINKYNVLKDLGWDSVSLYESPKEDIYFSKVSNILVASPEQAVKAMKQKAEEIGWKTEIATMFEGEARELGKNFIKKAKPGVAFLACGESTVTIKGAGLGGRNQELALSALEYMHPNQLLIALASDGHDNTDAAGAMVDFELGEVAKKMQLNPELYLEQNDSYHFFEAAGGHLQTGLTGSNVSDLLIVLTEGV